jgi:hypothetical protein
VLAPIPTDASNSVKQAFASVGKALDGLFRKDINLHGYRILNAGDAVMGSDYVPLRQLREISKDPQVVTQVRIITEQLGVGPWNRVGTATLLINTGDQVGIGLGVLPSTTPKLHIRSAAAASFPTIAANDFLVVENSAQTHIAVIGGATSNIGIRFYGSGDGAADGYMQYSRTTRNLTLGAAATDRIRVTQAGSFVAQLAGALATTATDGFTYIPSCAGTPTGVPTAIAGTIPVVYDSTNHIFYAYSGGAWRTH